MKQLKSTNTVLDELQELGPKLGELSCSINPKIDQVEEELRSYPVEFPYEHESDLLVTHVSPQETTGFKIAWKKHEGQWRFVFAPVKHLKEVFIEHPDVEYGVILLTYQRHPKYHEIYRKEQSSWAPLTDAPRVLRIAFLEHRDEVLGGMVKAIKSAVEVIERP